MEYSGKSGAILIVDDYIAAREGLAALLEASGRMPVPEMAATCHEAIEMTIALQPRVVILDLKLPDCDGVELIEILLRHCPGCRIIAISVSTELDLIAGALERGAMTFLAKDTLRHTLIAAIEKAFLH